MDTMLYDGDCGFCRATRSCLAALDVTRRVRWRTYQSLAEPPAGLAWDDLERAAYLHVRRTGGCSRASTPSAP